MNEISKINVNGTSYDLRDSSMTGQNIAALLESVNYSPGAGGGDTQPIYLGTSTSAADAQAKAATVDNSFILEAGVVVSIKYSNTNTYSATAENPITLEVNSTGPKHIYYAGAVDPTGTNTLIFGSSGQYVTYIYDGTNWVWFGHGYDSNSTYSAGTAALLTAGTNTTNRTWQAKILHDYISYPNVIYTVYAPAATSGSIALDYTNGPVLIITLSGTASAVTVSNIPDGHSMHVFFVSNNTSYTRAITIANNSTARYCPAGANISLTAPKKGYGYCEVDFLNANGVTYVRGL